MSKKNKSLGRLTWLVDEFSMALKRLEVALDDDYRSVLNDPCSLETQEYSIIRHETMVAQTEKLRKVLEDLSECQSALCRDD